MVGDAIQPSHPLSSPSSPAFDLFQHQWVSSSQQVATVLKLQLQHQSFQWIFRTVSFRIDWLDLHAVQGTLKSLLQHTVQRTYMYATCQMMSYSLCWDLTTKTEFKQCAKMRVKTHCPIYTHLVTRRGSCFTHGTVLNRYHARKGPGSPGRVIKYDHFYLGCNSFVFFGW